jgi:hypothetical protein
MWPVIDMFRQNQKLLIGTILGILAIVVIVIIVQALTGATGGGGGPTPSVSITPTPKLTSIDFSGFTSNMQLENTTVTNENDLSFNSNTFPIYNAPAITASYVAGKMGMKTDAATGLYESSSYYISNQPSSFTIVSFATASSGSTSSSGAQGVVNNFLKNTLALTTGSINFSTSLQGKVYVVSGSLTINNETIYSLTGASAFTAHVSTSGQLLTLQINGIYQNVTSVGDYPIGFSSVFNNYTVGVYSSSFGKQQNTPQIDNAPIDVSGYKQGYYYDSQTGYLFPVVYLSLNVTAQDTGATYPTTIIYMLVNSTYINQVNSTQGQNALNGAQP